VNGVGRTALGWVPAVLWATVIFVLSSQPTLPSTGQVTDKQAHAFTYGVLALLCLMGLTRWRWRSVAGARLLGAFALAAMYGVSDELHQAFVPGRSPDVGDVTADAAGAAIALGLVWAWAILLGRRSSITRA
jgi:VanZ family protein